MSLSLSLLAAVVAAWFPVWSNTVLLQPELSRHLQFNYAKTMAYVILVFGTWECQMILNESTLKILSQSSCCGLITFTFQEMRVSIWVQICDAIFFYVEFEMRELFFCWNHIKFFEMVMHDLCNMVYIPLKSPPCLFSASQWLFEHFRQRRHTRKPTYRQIHRRLQRHRVSYLFSMAFEGERYCKNSDHEKWN